MKRTLSCIALLLGAAAFLPGAARSAAKAPFSRRFVLVFANLNRAADISKLQGIMVRASAAGYNGIVLGTTSGQYIDLWNQPAPPAYAAAFAAIREQASHLHLQIIPYAINATEVGYARPELSEAIPCIDTPFVAAGHQATIDHPQELLQNPGFESYQGNSPQGWGHDRPGSITFIDTAVKHGGAASVRIQDTGNGDPRNGHGRLFQEVQVTPFRAYELSVWIKSEDQTDTDRAQFYIEGDDGQQPLVYANRDNGLGAPLQPTQDWRQYTIRFNSASNSRLEIYFGIWANRATGRLWFDDADLHEIGLVHTVRRDSLPVTVRAADGKATYHEGPDYQVEEGRLLIPAGSAIQDGERLRVSWYQRAEEIGEPFANSSQPGYWDVEKGIAQRLDSLFGHPRGFMMTYDEWRVANWDPAAGAITAGEYMAKTVRTSIDLLKSIRPDYDLYVWSDMFDPNENANPKYYLCNGPVTGSWKGLTPDVTVMTWDGDEKALEFFSTLGQRQIIAGYYDSLDNVSHWLDALDQAETHGATGIDGFLYTTWDDNYSDLERVAGLIKGRGRWG